MNPVRKIVPNSIYFRFRKPQLIAGDANKYYRQQGKMNLFLGIISAIVALPIVTLIVMSSVFFTPQQWEEFWDRFLEN